MENIVEKIIEDASKPLSEQYGKAIVIALAGTTATWLARKGYDAALFAYRNRSIVTPE